MSNKLKTETHPELVVGIAGPIGIDIEKISQEITSALNDVSYDTIAIHVTRVMENYPTSVTLNGRDYFSTMNYKMDYANKLAELFGSADTLMRITMQAIRKIREDRSNLTETNGQVPAEENVRPNTAFVIRQLKRPEEVTLLRKVYGKQFILVSGYGSQEQRKELIEKKIRQSTPIATPEHQISDQANRLIARDADETEDSFGQHLRDTYHLADVFIDGINQEQMRRGLNRFFQAFFGRLDIGPTKIEYGMYAAKSASLRSCDLSRQVGAAIFSPEGEVISQGCNEVPKSFGGTYWEGEEPDFRDIKLGYDPNDHLKKESIRGLLEALKSNELLSTKANLIPKAENLVEILLGQNSEFNNLDFYGILKGSDIASITEFGRVVHAEMSAICDAARLGKPIKNGVLYCTTFPCHNCTKHILAAGISQVIFIEPYPKSKAKELHKDEIELEKFSSSKVSFLPFLGISPYRYRDIFQKGSRKNNGLARTWLHDVPRPLLNITPNTHLDSERLEVVRLGGTIQQSFPV